MGLMNKFIEKIKDIFGKKDTKLLTDKPNISYESNNQKSAFFEDIKLNKQKTNKNQLEYEKGTLDYAIEQYVQGIGYSYEKGQNISSYKTLTSLFAVSKQNPGLNPEKEKALIESLEKLSDKYNVVTQNGNRK